MEPPWQPDYSPPSCSRLFICRTLTLADGLDLRRRFSSSPGGWILKTCSSRPDWSQTLVLPQPGSRLRSSEGQRSSGGFQKPAFSCLLLSGSCQTQLCRVSVGVLTVAQARTSSGGSGWEPSPPAFLAWAAAWMRFSLGSSPPESRTPENQRKRCKGIGGGRSAGVLSKGFPLRQRPRLAGHAATSLPS